MLGAESPFFLRNTGVSADVPIFTRSKIKHWLFFKGVLIPEVLSLSLKVGRGREDAHWCCAVQVKEVSQPDVEDQLEGVTP
ncbi:hypothetical protein TUM20903_02890 [Citrobacter koseri]|jgi:hypothetical protein|nr:hypothetical protein HMPREF3220_04813 [Citrobacter koseri]BCL46477.1 hypothetical protein MPUCK001_02950 [Citrobacter koseri]BDG82701.1 hypothetical protein TUM13189_02610 [Citrobacter koseri]BDG87551.1 hypothetical protein TUM20903_02890 [Citrobacter koseri]